jgi:signal transduction histidine kinase
LVIPTPFWNTVWFQIFIGCGIVVLMLWAYRLRTTKIRERQRDLEERLSERELYQGMLARQYQEIKIQKEKAEESDRIKSEFLAQVSHEIRTPLQVMLNHTSLLKDRCKNNEELMDSFSTIDSSGIRLIRTIDSILNMSQIQAGALEVHPKKLDLSMLVKKITEEFRPHADAKNLELKYTMNSVDTTAVVDEYTISHLVQNLIDNAIKYTNKGTVNVSVARNREGKLYLEVKDTGIGISENYQKNLFSPFSQEDSGYTRKFDGAGLGLSLVKNYCELNSAEILVESEKGKGSKFTVVFKT